jgi:hypothetical protein
MAAGGFVSLVLVPFVSCFFFLLVALGKLLGFGHALGVPTVVTYELRELQLV